MRPEQVRATLQSAFLLLVMPVLFLLGLGCFCYPPPQTGSDSGGHEALAFADTQDMVVAGGLVYRYHMLTGMRLQASQGEAQAFQQALPGSFIGVRVPTSPSGSQPGQLQNGSQFGYNAGRGYTMVPLKQDATQSARLNTLFPPPSGTEWAALVISDTHALDSLLQAPVNWNNTDTFLNYVIDFGGTDTCNGCEVQLVSCMPGKFAALLPPGPSALRQAAADPSLICTPPISTYITIFDFSGKPKPGAPVVAAFGLWGNQPTTSTVNGGVVMPLTLQQTGETTMTFNLDTIQSALGWSYRWENAQHTPITQIAVPPVTYAGLSAPPDLYVAATGLPTCTQVIDVVSLQATSLVTPSLQAKTQAYVNVLPDPATCPVADLATYHVQATDVISAGNGITYTLTISNLTNAVVGGIVQQTIAPASAVGGAELPAGCSRSGAVVTCQLDDIAAQGARSATVVIQSNAGFTGVLSSNVKATPVGATDPAFLDNIDGPLAATVEPNGNATGLYLPQLNTGQ